VQVHQTDLSDGLKVILILKPELFMKLITSKLFAAALLGAGALTAALPAMAGKTLDEVWRASLLRIPTASGQVLTWTSARPLPLPC
jgi:hypothetical protein